MKAYYESQEKTAYTIYYLFYNALAQLENIISRDIIGYIGLGNTCPITLATTCTTIVWQEQISFGLSDFYRITCRVGFLYS